MDSSEFLLEITKAELIKDFDKICKNKKKDTFFNFLGR